MKITLRIGLAGTLAAVLMVGYAVPARADTITLSSSELASFEYSGWSGWRPLETANLGNGTYSAQWDPEADGNYVAYGNSITWSSPRGGTGDTFSLDVHNDYGGDWYFGVSYNNRPTTFIAIEQGAFRRYDIILDESLTKVSVVASKILPENSGIQDRSVQYTLTVPNGGSVPDGGSTAALLASVLVAFGVVRRRFSGR